MDKDRLKKIKEKSFLKRKTRKMKRRREKDGEGND